MIPSFFSIYDFPEMLWLSPDPQSHHNVQKCWHGKHNVRNSREELDSACRLHLLNWESDFDDEVGLLCDHEAAKDSSAVERDQGAQR